MKDNTIAATALVGFAIWETANAYGQFAPSLASMRDSRGDDTSCRQQLLDCDCLVGGTALLAGLFAAYLSRSWIPLAVVFIAFLWISGYHHLVLKGPTPNDLTG